MLGKLHTRDLLVKKGYYQLIRNVCAFCQQSFETIDHLLLTCIVPWQILTNYCAEAWGVNVGVPGTVVDHYDLRLSVAGDF